MSALAALWTRAQAQEAKRANSLLEEELARTKLRDERMELANQVRWVVEPIAHMTYVLRNAGTHEARHVKVASESVVFLSGPIVQDNGVLTMEEESVPAGGGIKFTAPGPSAYVGRGHDLEVVWQGASGPVVVPMTSPPPSPPPSPTRMRTP